jgi:hypothetical protein
MGAAKEFFEDQETKKREAWEAKAKRNGWICKLDGAPLEPEEVGQDYCNEHLDRLARLEKE